MRGNIFLERVAEQNEILDEASAPVSIALDQIDPNPQQSRQVFDEDKLAGLAASIDQHGVMQPIGVRLVGDRYVIIYGERRYRAARMAGLSEIPATVHEVDPQEAAIMTALENLQSEDLDIEDEARYFQTLLDATGLSQRRLAAQLGINHVYIARRVKLLSRPDLLDAYRQGLLTLHEAAAPDETVSQGNTLLEAEMVEREELDTEPVSLGNTFRWRPMQRSYAILQRLKPEQVPGEERETFKQMLDGMQTEIDRLRGGLG